MLLLFFVYFLSAQGLPVPTTNDESTSSSCVDYGHCRSLLSIIWSCLTTIFLCTWVAIHPNIPEPVDTREMSIWDGFIHKLKCFFGDKVPLFICALLVPEYILAWAVRQHLMARKIVKENSGLTRVHGFFIIMGGFHYFEGSDKMGREYKAVYPLTGDNVISMLKADLIALPTEGELQNQSKSDWIAKTLVFLQTLWFITQCIARRIEHLPTTELEIVTLAYTALNVGIFIAWWDKPRNVACPIRVFQKPTERAADYEYHWWENILFIAIGAQDKPVELHKRRQVPMFYSGGPKDPEIWSADVITLVAGVAFGAIHCVAWSFDFSSHTELLLWRISSIAITAVPVALPIIIIVSAFLAKFANEALLYPVLSLMPPCGLLYIAARFTTLVLAFMNLSSLPSGAFETVHWTTLLPHL